MKHTKEHHNENFEDTEELHLKTPASKTESSPAKPKDNAVFEVSGKQKKEESHDAGDQQDALFEVSEISKVSACDDEIPDLPVDKAKEETPSDKKTEELSLEKKKIQELTEQLEAVNDKYLRLMAEFDNFKRRSAKEYERMVEAANEKLMKEIIEVRENFERAFKSKAEGEKLLEGMKLIFAKLNTILQKHGLEVYAEAGQKFEPEIHDALMRMPHEKIIEGHIVEVHERGYKLKGNIIKHAKVVVSSGKPQKKENEKEAVIEIK
jgi:molecular chaperone GrpE